MLRALLLSVVVTGVLATPSALAHTVLQSSSPVNGAFLRNPPEQVSLTFNEAVLSPVRVSVTAPDGARVEQGVAKLRAATVRQRLHRLDAPGRYTIAYRAVSDDGHPVTGQLSFTLTLGERATSRAVHQAAPSGGTDDHEHSGWLTTHWVHVLPVVAIGVGWGITLTSGRRRRRSADSEAPLASS